jgi:hypothetical protein
VTIATATKIARQIAGGNYGYNQAARWSGISAGKLHTPGAFDCSSSCGVIAWLGGFIDRSVLGGTFWTGNFAKKLTATGMYRAITVKGWPLAKLTAAAREGDFIVGPGHVVYCLGAGKVVSFEADERGKASGGKAGDQTGREGRIRDLYHRSKGWTYLVRPWPAEHFQTAILDGYADTGKPSESLLDKLRHRSPWDGPRWAEFMASWAVWDKGMRLAWTAGDLVDVPDAGHAFVVLGGSLNADGSIKPQFRRRLALATLAAGRHGASRVVITGGAPKAGRTEAAAGKAWMAAAGIDPARIITETSSASTIGNAKNTVPLLAKNKITSYTLVSDASHLRRASVLFAAAQLLAETATNRRLGLAACTPLAVNDYEPRPVKTAGPIDPDDRHTIVTETASLLGLA